MPLYGLESGDPLSDFDIIAFTLQYELSFSNILNMLDLGGIPVLAKRPHGAQAYRSLRRSVRLQSGAAGGFR